MKTILSMRALVFIILQTTFWCSQHMKMKTDADIKHKTYIISDVSNLRKAYRYIFSFNKEKALIISSYNYVAMRWLVVPE